MAYYDEHNFYVAEDLSPRKHRWWQRLLIALRNKHK